MMQEKAKQEMKCEICNRAISNMQFAEYLRLDTISLFGKPLKTSLFCSVICLQKWAAIYMKNASDAIDKFNQEVLGK